MLAQLGSTDMDAAYRALRRYSRDNKLKLSAVAEAVVNNEVDLDAVLSSER